MSRTYDENFRVKTISVNDQDPGEPETYTAKSEDAEICFESPCGE